MPTTPPALVHEAYIHLVDADVADRIESAEAESSG
jgi:hypothetical protein